MTPSSRLPFVFAVALIASAGIQVAAAAVIPAEPLAGPGARPDAAQLEFFEKSIRPVLVEKCYSCHSAEADKSKGGLLLDTREGIRQGGDSGHAVVPGNLEESVLIAALRWHDKDLRMPPEKEGGKLPDSVIADFEKWVKMGAPDPRDGQKQTAKKEIDFEQAKQFWAFQTPKAAKAPAVKDASWPRSDVDRFIRAAQEAKGLAPVADADKRSLLRRIYFDLIGLPPSPQEVDAFLKDTSANAFAKVVDRLLGLPQFGERWGRHWLDAARYAESTGKERNFTFPNAWRYRDYVIHAFNADKPYDQFIREQIAGDLLPAKDQAERDAHLIATGFLALGPKGLNEKNREQFRMDLIDEQIDATSRAVLGVTVACARCHDHKFDPIPQREYYSLAGIFRSTETRFGTAGEARNKNGTPLLSLGGTAPTATKTLSNTAPSTTTAPPTKAPAVNKKELEARVAALIAQNPQMAKRYAELPPGKKAEVGKRLLAQNAGKLGGNAAKKNKGYQAGANKADVEASGPQAMGVADGSPSDARLYIRGEIDSPSDTVPRGFLTVLTNGTAPSIPGNASGRLELADWLTAPANPLTARVMVNRAWQHLFGQGLVRTPDNFGATGEKPSHPELLDALAVQFARPANAAGGMGWSVKKLIRSLVLSRTYQLSSALDKNAAAADPDNVLLWRATPRRLDAEAIRDAMLTASGQIDLKPPQGSIVANVGDGYIGRGIRPEAFASSDARYRSVYLPIVRDFVPDVLEVFDFAEPSLVVVARDVTNVPSQALFLMNSDFVRGQADAMGRRIVATPLDHAQRIALAYELALCRKPTDAERVRAEQYLLNEARGLIPVKSGNTQEAAQLSWATFCQTLFACAEFRYLK